MTNPNFRSIRGCSGSKFVFDKKPRPDQKLWPFGPEGWKMHRNTGLRYKQNVAEKVSDIVMDRSGFNEEKLLHGLRDTVGEVKAVYPNDVREKLDDEKELLKLARDSILFVLLVFSILGATLHFPDQHVIFGTGHVREEIEKWLRSIFFVGNQIPLVMAETLMESLNYLKNLREEVRQMDPPVELLERTLYDFVTKPQESRPVDVLDCLRSNLLGPESEQIHVWVVGHNDPGMPQLSASGLSKQGYTFEALAIESGSREIECKNRWCKVVVVLPFLEVVSEMHLEVMMNSVVNYEDIHGFQPESRYYFNFVSNLIRMPEDVDVLREHGVIGGVNLDCLPGVLEPFYQGALPNTSLCVNKVIQMSKPRFHLFWRFKWLILVAYAVLHLLITIAYVPLQTGSYISGYFKHRRSYLRQPA